jgi:hypothetical protein
MTYKLDGWQDITTVDGWELRRRLEREFDRLTYDLKICGSGYPSPRKAVIQAIHVELARRNEAMSAMTRTVWVVVLVALTALSVLFMVGVFAGWWPYQWWEMFR